MGQVFRKWSRKRSLEKGIGKVLINSRGIEKLDKYKKDIEIIVGDIRDYSAVEASMKEQFIILPTLM